MLSCSDPTRRTLLLAALATGAYMASSRSAAADEDQPGSDERPQKADVLVFSEGEHAGEVIKPQDLKLGGPPVSAWPRDSKTSVVRKGSRLNEILIIRLDPAELDDETRSRSADGIVACSAVCTHAGCPVTGWLKAETGDKDVLVPLPQLRIQSPRRRASRVRAGSAAVGCASAYSRRRLAYRSCNICWKGRCSATGMRGRGRNGFPRPNDRTTHQGGG